MTARTKVVNLRPPNCSVAAPFHGAATVFNTGRIVSLVLAAIAFPHLQPVLIRVGPLAVRWYGVSYLAGFLCAYLVLVRLSRCGHLRASATLVGDLMTWL